MDRIRVTERNDPKVLVWVNVLNPDRSKTPYDFTDATVEFWQKADKNLPDPAQPTYSTTTGSIIIEATSPLDENGKPITESSSKNVLTVQMTAANLATPGIQAFRIDSIRNGKRLTVMEGPLVIENA